MFVNAIRHAPFAGIPFSRLQHGCMSASVDRLGAPPASDDGLQLAALVRAVSSGNRGAFAELYERTSGKLYGICLRLLGSEAEAQDVLQDVYVTLWQKAGRFDPAKAGVTTWLGVLARNRSIDRLRQRGPAAADLEAAADVRDDGPSALEIVERTQDAVRLDRCLDELEDRARAMIRAAFLEGATYPELAEREDVPLGTMKSWIRRGLQRLRGCLER